MKKTITPIISLIILCFLLTYHLGSWPVIWYDEGLHLQAAKNLAVSGVYGLRTLDGFSAFDPLVTAGPTVILPIALIFKIFGVSLLPARLVIIGYAILLTACIFILSMNVFNRKVALAATLLLLVTPLNTTDLSGTFFGLSRMVMGEIPALFYFIIGMILWFRALDHKNTFLLFGAGFLWGLAIVTKQQYLLLIVSLLFIWLVDKFRYHLLDRKQIVIPLLVSLAIGLSWLFFQSIASNGSAGGQQGLLDRIGTQLTILSPTLIIRSLRVLLGSGSIVFGLPGLIYAILLCKQAGLLSFKIFALIIFVSVWSAWFIFGSISWTRYAFPIFCVMNIFTAKLLGDLTHNFTFSFKGIFSKSTPNEAFQSLAISLAVMIILVMLVIIPAQELGKEGAVGTDTSPQEFAQYISSHVSSDAVIETFEPEIAFLSNDKFHQPEIAIQNLAIRHVQFGEPYSPNCYQPEKFNLSYLAVGPFGKLTGIYQPQLDSGNYQFLTSVGQYDLYKYKLAN